jgi:hypothetical protein
MKTQLGAAAGALALIAAVGFGQITSASGRMEPNGQFTATAGFSPPRFAMPAVAGAPYSAEQVSEHTQTLNDGTHISQPSSSMRMYRDSAGRTRTERPFMLPPQVQPDAPSIVEINDPVSGFQYILDSVSRVAHRSVLPPPNVAAASSTGATNRVVTGAIGGAPSISFASVTEGPAPHAGAPMRPDFSSQSLGTQMMNGLLVEGKLTTTTYPVGAMGNDRPIVATSEVWMSPDLKLMVLAKFSDPRTGERTTRLANISRADPDPRLFQVPPDYQIVDESGPFTIRITRP